MRMTSRVSATKASIRSRYRSRPRVARLSPFLGEDPVEHELGGDAGVVEPGQEQRRVADHPCVPDHQVLDRGPLGMAEVEAARDVGRRLDDHERRQRRVRRRARAVRREDVRREPALVDVVLELARARRRARARAAWPPLVRLRHRSAPGNKTPRRPADERGRGTTCWFDAGACRSSRPAGPASSSARYRAPPARLASDLRVRRARAARTVPRSLRGRPGPTLLGRRREARSLPRGIRHQSGAGPRTGRRRSRPRNRLGTRWMQPGSREPAARTRPAQARERDRVRDPRVAAVGVVLDDDESAAGRERGADRSEDGVEAGRRSGGCWPRARRRTARRAGRRVKSPTTVSRVVSGKRSATRAQPCQRRVVAVKGDDVAPAPEHVREREGELPVARTELEPPRPAPSTPARIRAT